MFKTWLEIAARYIYRLTQVVADYQTRWASAEYRLTNQLREDWQTAIETAGRFIYSLNVIVIERTDNVFNALTETAARYIYHLTSTTTEQISRWTEQNPLQLTHNALNDSLIRLETAARYIYFLTIAETVGRLGYLLQEDGFYLLQEDGSRIILEP